MKPVLYVKMRLIGALYALLVTIEFMIISASKCVQKDTLATMKLGYVIMLHQRLMVQTKTRTVAGTSFTAFITKLARNAIQHVRLASASTLVIA
jgi:hypothetical protein